MNPLDTTRGEAETALQRSAGIPVDPYKDWSEQALAALKTCLDANTGNGYVWANAMAVARQAVDSYTVMENHITERNRERIARFERAQRGLDY